MPCFNEEKVYKYEKKKCKLIVFSMNAISSNLPETPQNLCFILFIDCISSFLLRKEGSIT